MQMDHSVNGRVGCALVTGASRGIGAEIARQLARDGWPVAVAYQTNAQAAESVVHDIELEGGRAASFAADLADHQAPTQLLEAIEAAFAGPVLVLVNNAGIARDRLTIHLEDDDWDAVLNTNLSAAFRLTRAVLADMRRAGFGRVINIASVAALRGRPGQGNYAAAKGGLVAWTKAVALEVARRGVTVNAVAPGWIETDMTAEMPDRLYLVPARRVGVPRDVAAYVRFLASEDASYITGTVLAVDGGLSA
jgi:3-oxoacyl-[acyl-carrier protein] reductase